MPVVCVPSLKRSRVFYDNTFQSIPKSWRKRTYLFVHKSEVKDYVSHEIPKRQIIPIPDKLKGLGRFRQFVVDNSPSDKILLLDDDLKICNRVRVDKNKYRVRTADDRDLEECYGLVFGWLKDKKIAQTAIGSEWRCHEKPAVVENAMCGMAVGLDIKKMRISEIRYDTFPMIMSDVQVCLNFLLHGYQNKLTFDYVLRRLPPNTGGGSSVYRTREMMDEWSNKLAIMFPKLVSVYKRSNDWPGLGPGTTNARVYWKKAAEIAANGVKRDKEKT